MPAWSPEIANDFIRMAAADGRAFDQMQLQKLVYIAHGWCLATFDEPLTGDRPEAWEFGPRYRKLAEALASYGRDPVTREVRNAEFYDNLAPRYANMPACSNLDEKERDLIARIYQDYGSFDAAQLSILTSGNGAPWAEVFAKGSGKFHDIPHALIRAQFAHIATQAREQTSRS